MQDSLIFKGFNLEHPLTNKKNDLIRKIEYKKRHIAELIKRLKKSNIEEIELELEMEGALISDTDEKDNDIIGKIKIGSEINKEKIDEIRLKHNKEIGEMQKELIEIVSHNSKFLANRTILQLAIVYENVDFYIPNFMDFRGRIYSAVSYLNYQGSDIARSLIEFAEGCDLNNDNIKYVYLYLANTAGRNKLAIDDKIK